jgi:hypothetical protein
VRRRSRGLATIERSRRSLPTPARDRRRRIPIRDAFHPSGAFAPQRSLERPAPALPRRAAYAAPPSRRHRWRRSSLATDRARSPFTRLVAGETAFLWTWDAARRLLQPDRRAGTPYELSIPRARVELLRAPLLAGTRGCRLRWLPRCVAAPGAGEPRSARGGLRSLRSTGVDRADRESDHPRKVGAIGRTLRTPSRNVPRTRVTGAYRCELWSVSRRSAQA